MKSSNLYQAVCSQITYILPSSLLLQDRSQSFLRDCLPRYTHPVGSNKTSISFLSWLLINFSLTNTLIHPSFCAGVSYSYISWIKWNTALGPHFPGEWRCLSALVKELPRVGSPEGLTVQASWFLRAAAPSPLLGGLASFVTVPRLVQSPHCGAQMRV